MKVTVTCWNELSPTLGKISVKFLLFQYRKGPLGSLLRPKRSHNHNPKVQSSKNLASGSASLGNIQNIKISKHYLIFVYQNVKERNIFLGYSIAADQFNNFLKNSQENLFDIVMTVSLQLVT